MFNSVVKEICFKHVQDIITTSLCDNSLTTNLVPSTSFHVKLSQKALGTRLSNNRKEKFYCICCRNFK